MIERSLLPSVPVGSGRHVMRLGHGGERAVGRATGGAVPAVTMSMTMEVVAAAAVVVAAAGVEEDIVTAEAGVEAKHPPPSGRNGFGHTFFNV